jgi:hypothetical protein
MHVQLEIFKTKKMEEEKKLKSEFLEVLKAMLLENNVRLDITNDVIMGNNILDCAKEIGIELDVLLNTMLSESDQTSNKQQIRFNFESSLTQKIKCIIENKTYLNSRLDSKITSGNLTLIRSKVTEFSDKYFILETPLKV